MGFFGVNWVTTSSLATAAGTLVLSFATFAAVRSSNRSARIAEAALQEQRRPLLAPSRLEDPTQKIMFIEGYWVSAAGGRAAVEDRDGAVYLAISLRNVGSGIAVCQGWAARPGEGAADTHPSHVPLEDFRLQSRDLYVPAGDIGMWQGGLRNPDDPIRAELVDAIETGQPLMVEVLYSDLVGRQRTISRFSLYHAGDSWLSTINRVWFLDWEGPRPEELKLAAVEVVLRDREAAIQRRAATEGSDGEADAGGAVAAGGVPSDAERANPSDR
ncbi:MAG TPA: hypothetical protein VGI44_07300 [Acidimicrobiales bacterium]|jgi:hypothetical protein